MFLDDLAVQIAWSVYLRTRKEVLRDNLIKHYIGYSNTIVRKKMKNHSQYMDDLIEAGYMGLVQAFDRWNPTPNGKPFDKNFKAWAYLRITGAALDELRKINHVPYRNNKEGQEKRNMYRLKNKDLGYYIQEHDFIERETVERFYKDVFVENIFDLNPEQLDILNAYSQTNMSYREIANHMNLTEKRVIYTNRGSIKKIKNRIAKDHALKEFYMNNLL